jgi:hypothetical protein
VRRFKWKCLPQLLDGSSARRMLRDVNLQDAPPLMADDKEAVEHAERDRCHSEEIHGRNRFSMVSKEGQPGQDLSAPASSNGRWFSRKDQNRACGVPHESAVLPTLGSRQPSGKSIPESPSASVSFQPTSGLWISLQYIRKPARCQRATVSGLTTRRACFHPD